MTKQPAFQLPGITPASTAKLHELLEKNHKWEILFDGYRHNHGAHVLLTCYSLGASPEELEAQYEDQLEIQRELSPTRYDNAADKLKDRKVFEAHLGDPRFYHDYLVFFEQEIKQHGFNETLTHYYGDPCIMIQAHMGVLHGVIHLGYAIDFENDMILAEALALCSVQPRDFDFSKPRFTNWVFDAEKKAAGQSQTDALSFSDILKDVRSRKEALGLRTDEPFDNTSLVSPDNYANPEMSAKLEQTFAKWALEPTHESIQEKLKELATETTLLYACTNLKESDPVTFDFILIHMVTSLYFLPLILKFFSLEKQVTMVKMYMRYLVIIYIIAGAPEVHGEWLQQTDENDDEPSSAAWANLLQQAVAYPDLHLVKIVRTLAHWDSVYGKEDQYHYFYKAAKRTLNASKNGFPWVFGIGYKVPKLYDIPAKDDGTFDMMMARFIHRKD
ncbi:hypothetical protein DM01DRAFT_1331180 [Hesseltinella vesiculosa]|uniref:Oxidoreductase AflY n=1 Tax=Hesseltinella vesiculosa TaxID=101127 RepID=A0A1X2GYC7_9FUNG|nr:hypothetical protein DM01DRAFT_1331180 [Hesseltinella vesiculosa]